jgi:hypothetical protein
MSIVWDLIRQRTQPPGPPPSRRVGLTVYGPPPEQIEAVIVPDLSAPLGAERTDRHLSFFVPGAVTGGATLYLSGAQDYVPQESRLVLPAGDTELDAVTLERVVAQPVARRGLVRREGRTLVDDDGPFLGLGTSLFWAPWGYQHNLVRLEANLAYLAGKVDYIRVLAAVGPSGAWEDRTSDPTDPAWAESLAGQIDLAYDTYGLRTQVTIFGGLDKTPTAAAREALVRRVAGIVAARPEKVVVLEVANEAWGTGWGDNYAEIKRLADLLRDLTPNIVSTTAVDVVDLGSGPELNFRDWYRGSRANLAMVHVDRSFGDRGWRHVRQARDPNLFWGGAWASNEPIGPQSSVAADNDPLRLTMAAAYTWLCNGASYVLHTGAGIRGGGVADLARGRSANIWEVPHIAEILAGLNAVRKLLPADLPNWNFQNNNRQAGIRHPFNTDRLVPLVEGGQLLRAFAAIDGDGRFVMMPILADVPIPFEARSSMHVDVYDPLTGTLREAHDLDAGETWIMPPTLSAVVIGRSR